MELQLSVESFKDLFFDKAVAGILDKEEKRALGKMGAYTRTVARNSLKYETGKRATSAPGQPPVVHRKVWRVRRNNKTGEVKSQQVSMLKELLFFGIDPSSHSVVVGPAFFKSDRRTRPVNDTVPGVLEKGGTVAFVRTEPVKKGGRRATEKQKTTFLRKLADGTLRRMPREVEKQTTLSYSPRPFMKPALAASMNKFPTFFKGG